MLYVILKHAEQGPVVIFFPDEDNQFKAEVWARTYSDDGWEFVSVTVAAPQVIFPEDFEALIIDQGVAPTGPRGEPATPRSD